MWLLMALISPSYKQLVVRCVWEKNRQREMMQLSLLFPNDKTDFILLWCNYWHYTSPLHLIYILLFSHSVVSDSFRPHGLQHARVPGPSRAPRVCSNSCPLSWCCRPAISSSVAPFSSCPQSFAASGSFPMSRLFHLYLGFVRHYRKTQTNFLAYPVILKKLIFFFFFTNLRFDRY